ncbi:hypothetical protein Q0P27_14295, partial [Staphylococcus aureus]|nr:hypothetical protein [Staphylococcus aureus]
AAIYHGDKQRHTLQIEHGELLYCQNYFDGISLKRGLIWLSPDGYISASDGGCIMTYRSKVAVVYLLGFFLDLVNLFIAS